MQFLLVALLASLVCVSLQQNVQEALKGWQRSLSPLMNQCMCQSGVKQGAIDAFFQFGEIPNEPCFKCNLRCWAEGSGIFSATGKINMDRLTSFTGVTHEIANKCRTVDHADLCEKTYQLALCVYNSIAAPSPNPIVRPAPVPVVSHTKQWYPSKPFYK